MVRDRSEAEDHVAGVFNYVADAGRGRNVNMDQPLVGRRWIGPKDILKTATINLAAKVFGLFFVMLLVSCSGGPTDENVRDAMEGAFEAIDVLPIDFDESALEKFHYRDNVTISKHNDDYTLILDISFGLNRDSGRMDLELLWTYDGYIEPKSGNALYGTTTITGFGNIYDNSYSEEDISAKCDLNYSGGKVESLSFTLDEAAMAKNEMPDLLVNGAPYVFSVQPEYSPFIRQAISFMRSKP